VIFFFKEINKQSSRYCGYI